jgi:hypothetical protein
MINLKVTSSIALMTGFALFGLAASATFAESPKNENPQATTEVVVTYPWTFQSGTKNAIKVAIESLGQIVVKEGSTPVSLDVARAAWKSGNFGPRTFGKTPTMETLQAFGKSVKATQVVYGDIAWNTTKTSKAPNPIAVSVATVDAFVLDVASGKVLYACHAAKGESNESISDLTFLANIYPGPITSQSTAGHQTQDEERAAQIALGRAFEGWIKISTTKAQL